MTKNNIFAIKFWIIFCLIYASITKFSFNNFGENTAILTVLGVGAIIFSFLVIIIILRIVMLFLDKNEKTQMSRILIRIEEFLEILGFRK